MIRWGRILAVSVVGVLGLTGTLVDLLVDGLSSDSTFAIVGVVFYLVAVLLVLRVPGNRMSWLLLVVSLGFGLMGYESLAVVGSDVANFVAIFALLLPGVGIFVPLWFPDGAPPPGAWRWIGTAAAVSVLGFLVSVVVGLVVGDFNSDIDGCYSASSCLELATVLLSQLLIPLAIISLVLRWVRSTGTERQQLKLVALSLALFGIGVVAEFIPGGQGTLAAEILFLIGLLSIPAALGITISRYRLYDIDRIISRTVSYGLLVGLLGLVFAVGALWIPQALGLENPLFVAGSTLAIAALFSPLRKRVQAVVDRRFNRSRYDAERVMAEFASTLRDRVDPDDVVEGWLGVVSETMQPAGLGVWVR